MTEGRQLPRLQGAATAGLGPPGTSTPASAQHAAPVAADAERELYVRRARLEGRSVARLRVVDHGDRCVVEAEAWRAGAPVAGSPVRPGPYVFPTAVEATRFVTQAVEALIALGCDVQAS